MAYRLILLLPRPISVGVPFDSLTEIQFARKRTGTSTAGLSTAGGRESSNGPEGVGCGDGLLIGTVATGTAEATFSETAEAAGGRRRGRRAEPGGRGAETEGDGRSDGVKPSSTAG